MLRLIFLLVIISQFVGCSEAVNGLYPPQIGDEIAKLFVVDHGWHTGIILERDNLNDDFLKMFDGFPGAQFLEFGWGDRQFYQAEKIDSFMAIRAAMMPTEPVIHVAEIPTHPHLYYVNSELIELEITRQGYQKLIASIGESFILDNLSRPIKVGLGSKDRGFFYRANGVYHAFNTCNNWTAKMIRSSGFPITVEYGVTSGNVMFQLKRYGQNSVRKFDKAKK
ncbi:MAG: DUF2459 domain-containing protein [Gammaproteobacteria bacterium]